MTLKFIEKHNDFRSIDNYIPNEHITSELLTKLLCNRHMLSYEKIKEKRYTCK